MNFLWYAVIGVINRPCGTIYHKLVSIYGNNKSPLEVILELGSIFLLVLSNSIDITKSSNQTAEMPKRAPRVIRL